MTIKHGHHPADVDRPGSDTWRHFHEGRAERVLIASPDLRVLFERTPDDYDPIGLARQYMHGADIVLTEGYKRRPLPKIEVFRRAVAEHPLYDPAAPNAAAVGRDRHRRPRLRGRLPGAPFQRHHLAPAAGQPGMGARRCSSTGDRAARGGRRRAPDSGGRAAAARAPRARSTTRSTASSPKTSSARSTSRPGPTPRWTATPPGASDVRGAPAKPSGAAPGGRAAARGPLSHPVDRPGRVRPHLHRRAAARRGRQRHPAGGHGRGRGHGHDPQGPRRRSEHPPGRRGHPEGRHRARSRAPSWARRSSACSPRSPWRIRWCTAGPGWPSSAAATRSWTSTSRRRS